MDYSREGGSRIGTRARQVRHIGNKFKELFAPRWGLCTIDPESVVSLL